jgi:hypothetical protein
MSSPHTGTQNQVDSVSLKNYVEKTTATLLDALKSNPININQRLFDSLRSIFDTIIQNPYSDFFRVVDSYHYPLSRIFTSDATINYLKGLGFIQARHNKQLIFPHDAMIAALILAHDMI